MAMFSTATENALLQQESLPKFASIEPSQLTPAVTELVETLDKDFDKFETKISAEGYDATYDNVMPELEKMQFPLGYGKCDAHRIHAFSICSWIPPSLMS